MFQFQGLGVSYGFIRLRRAFVGFQVGFNARGIWSPAKGDSATADDLWSSINPKP